MKLTITIALVLLSFILKGQDNKITLETGGQIGIRINNPTSTLDIRGKESNGIDAAIRIIDGNPNFHTLLIDGNDIETYIIINCKYCEHRGWQRIPFQHIHSCDTRDLSRINRWVTSAYFAHVFRCRTKYDY